jgi:hypothetical protein
MIAQDVRPERASLLGRGTVVLFRHFCLLIVRAIPDLAA